MEARPETETETETQALTAEQGLGGAGRELRKEPQGTGSEFWTAPEATNSGAWTSQVFAPQASCLVPSPLHSIYLNSTLTKVW